MSPFVELPTAPKLTEIQGRKCLLSRFGGAIEYIREARALIRSGWHPVEPETWSVHTAEGIWIAFEDAASALSSAASAA